MAQDNMNEHMAELNEFMTTRLQAKSNWKKMSMPYDSNWKAKVHDITPKSKAHKTKKVKSAESKAT